MSNPNPRLENLTSFKPKWKSGKTRTIRVPVAIAKRVLEVAHQIDEGESHDTSDTNQNTLPLSHADNHLGTEANNIIDTSESIDKNLAQSILIEGLAVPSNKGGEVKQHLAKLGRMLGFEIKKNSKKQWAITDTSK